MKASESNGASIVMKSMELLMERVDGTVWGGKKVMRSGHGSQLN